MACRAELNMSISIFFPTDVSNIQIYYYIYIYIYSISVFSTQFSLEIDLMFDPELVCRWDWLAVPMRCAEIYS